jgi:osmoprotectant transport system ATP-binding protein
LSGIGHGKSLPLLSRATGRPAMAGSSTIELTANGFWAWTTVLLVKTAQSKRPRNIFSDLLFLLILHRFNCHRFNCSDEYSPPMPQPLHWWDIVSWPLKAPMNAAIEFRSVSFATPQGGGLLLDNVSLSIEASTTTAILGRSGSGKTTLLRTVNRMLEPTSGEVLLHGTNIAAKDLIALRRGMGYVIQETGLFPHFTVERNVGIVLEAQGCNRAVRLRRSHELLATVGLDPDSFAARYPHQLSGGQRQRVGLARALAAAPQILLMDEPFGALDPLTRAEMQDMLRGLIEKLSITVLLVTHDLDEALYLAQRIVLLDQGKLIADLPAIEFRQSHEPLIESYIRAFHRGEEAVRR